MKTNVEQEFREELLASLAKMLSQKDSEEETSSEEGELELNEMIARVLGDK